MYFLYLSNFYLLFCWKKSEKITFFDKNQNFWRDSMILVFRWIEEWDVENSLIKISRTSSKLIDFAIWGWNCSYCQVFLLRTQFFIKIDARGARKCGQKDLCGLKSVTAILGQPHGPLSPLFRTSPPQQYDFLPLQHERQRKKKKCACVLSSAWSA